jgi:cysteine-rich repeat protein
VPWEHQPETCMTSACGDGWRDERANEACDDGDALERGGCSADCRRVNDGFSCGDRATGCTRNADAGAPAAADAGAPGPDAGAPAAGNPQVTPTPRGGCTSAPAWLTAGALVVWAGRRRASKR